VHYAFGELAGILAGGHVADLGRVEHQHVGEHPSGIAPRSFRPNTAAGSDVIDLIARGISTTRRSLTQTRILRGSAP
jgi:hypothetical protein